MRMCVCVHMRVRAFVRACACVRARACVQVQLADSHCEARGAAPCGLDPAGLGPLTEAQRARFPLLAGVPAAALRRRLRAIQVLTPKPIKYRLTPIKCFIVVSLFFNLP